jgi:hypothetical protein
VQLTNGIFVAVVDTGGVTRSSCVWRVVAASRSSYVVVMRVLIQLLVQASVLGSGTPNGQWSLLLLVRLFSGLYNILVSAIVNGVAL